MKIDPINSSDDDDDNDDDDRTMMIVMCKARYRTLTFNVDLVAENDKREVLLVTGRSLDKELLSPRLQVLEALRGVHVVHKHTAVRAAVERHTERLEALLSGSVPDLDDARNGADDVSVEEKEEKEEKEETEKTEETEGTEKTEKTEKTEETEETEETEKKKEKKENEERKRKRKRKKIMEKERRKMIKEMIKEMKITRKR